MHHEMPTWADFLAAWELFRDPIFCAAIAGAALGFLSVYVLLKRMVFVSLAVAQSAGLGVALAFYAEIHLATHVDPLIGAGVLALGATLLFSVDPEKLHLTRESLLGLAFAFTGGAAILVGDRIAQEAHDVQAILYGTAVVVRPLDLLMVAIVGGISLLVHVLWFRGIAFSSFDPTAARVQGLPVGLLSGFVLVSIGAMVGVSARALGALPVFAFSTLPALAALVLKVPLPWTFAVAAVLGVAGGVGGYLVAFFFEFPVGGAQTVLTGMLAFTAIGVRLVLRALFSR